LIHFIVPLRHYIYSTRDLKGKTHPDINDSLCLKGKTHPDINDSL
jgi:hypothetical protein